MGRLQQAASLGTMVLGLILALTADREFALFGWFVAVLGLLGLFASVLLARVSRRDR